jgi:hypothetical protein
MNSSPNGKVLAEQGAGAFMLRLARGAFPDLPKHHRVVGATAPSAQHSCWHCRAVYDRNGIHMKVVLFCGGLGTRIREYGDNIPKGMIPIGDV